MDSDLKLTTGYRGWWPVVVAEGDVDTADTFLFQAVLTMALERRAGWLIVDLSGTRRFEVLPLAVLTKVRARAISKNGQLRVVVADDAESILADLDRVRWNIMSSVAEATRWPSPVLQPVR
jgi:anti-anti-sigma regulatory factor